MTAHRADDLTNDILSANEMLFHVYALHYVSTENREEKKDVKMSIK